MYDEQMQANKAKDLQSQGQTDLYWPPCITIHVGLSRAVASLLRQVTKVGVSWRQLNDIAVIDIFNEKRKSCNHRCPDSVYFHTLLLIILFKCYRKTYLS